MGTTGMWRPHGDNVGTTLGQHEDNVETTWGPQGCGDHMGHHGDNMGTTGMWRPCGDNMETTWGEHKDNVETTWGRQWDHRDVETTLGQHGDNVGTTGMWRPHGDNVSENQSFLDEGAIVTPLIGLVLGGEVPRLNHGPICFPIQNT